MNESLFTLVLTFSAFRVTKGTDETCVYLDYVGKEFRPSDVECPNDSVCNSSRIFNISYITTPPYFHPRMEIEKIMRKPLHNLLLRCCGYCTRITEVDILKNVAELTPKVLKEADMIFPMFATFSTTKLHGFHYLPLINIPDIIYITEKKDPSIPEFVEKVYPVVIVSILLAFVAGFICWLLETWGNKEEFPREFLIGWYQGIWWSFVTMTTVGYGDKSPRSFLGRIFSLIWIAVGILAFALLAGIVIVEVDVINNPPPPDMDGKTVGALLYRDYDAFMVAHHGGILKRNDELTHPGIAPYVDAFSDVMVLIDKLKNKQIDGFILDEYSFFYFPKILQGWANLVSTKYSSLLPLLKISDVNSTVKYYNQNTITEKKPYTGVQRLTYGALIKHHSDYLYFKDVGKDLGFTTMTNRSMEWSKGKDDKNVQRDAGSNLLFGSDGEVFRHFVYVLVGIIAGIFLIGFAYEVKRTKGNLKQILSKEV